VFLLYGACVMWCAVLTAGENQDLPTGKPRCDADGLRSWYAAPFLSRAYGVHASDGHAW
jgi:hypothetical protein